MRDRIVCTGWFRAFANMGLIVLSLFITLFVVDILAEFLIDEKHYKYVTPEMTSGYQNLRKPNQEVMWYGQPGAPVEYSVKVKTNSLGYNDREYPKTKAQGEMRIAVIGDSFVEGMTVEQEQASHRVLERLLRDSGKQVTVMAFGRSGWGPTAELAELSKVLDFHPDLVIQYILPANDISDSLPSFTQAIYDSGFLEAMIIERYVHGFQKDIDSWWVLKPFDVLRKWVVTHAGKAYKKYYFKIHHDDTLAHKVINPSVFFYAEPGGSPPIIENAWQKAFNALDQTHRILVRRGVAYLPVILPERNTKQSLQVSTMGYEIPGLSPERLVKRIEGHFAEKGTDYLSMTDTFNAYARNSGKKDSLYRVFDGHWNPAGNQLAAEFIYTYLIKHNEGRGLNASLPSNQIADTESFQVNNISTVFPKKRVAKRDAFEFRQPICVFTSQNQEKKSENVPVELFSAGNIAIECRSNGFKKDDKISASLYNEHWAMHVNLTVDGRGRDEGHARFFADKKALSLAEFQAPPGKFYAPTASVFAGQMILDINMGKRNFILPTPIHANPKIWPENTGECLTGNKDYPSQSLSIVNKVSVDGKLNTVAQKEFFDGVADIHQDPSNESIHVAPSNWGIALSEITLELDRDARIQGVTIVSASRWLSQRVDAFVLEVEGKDGIFHPVAFHDNLFRKSVTGIHFQSVRLEEGSLPTKKVKLIVGHSGGALSAPVSEIYLFGDLGEHR